MIGGKPLRPPWPRSLPWDITFSPASRSVVIFPTGRTAALPLICLLLRNCLYQKLTHYTLYCFPSLLSESKFQNGKILVSPVHSLNLGASNGAWHIVGVRGLSVGRVHGWWGRSAEASVN